MKHLVGKLCHYILRDSSMCMHLLLRSDGGLSVIIITMISFVYSSSLVFRPTNVIFEADWRQNCGTVQSGSTFLLEET